MGRHQECTGEQPTVGKKKIYIYILQTTVRRADTSQDNNVGCFHSRKVQRPPADERPRPSRRPIKKKVAKNKNGDKSRERPPLDLEARPREQARYLPAGAGQRSRDPRASSPPRAPARSTPTLEGRSRDLRESLAPTPPPRRGCRSFLRSAIQRLNR